MVERLGFRLGGWPPPLANFFPTIKFHFLEFFNLFFFIDCLGFGRGIEEKFDFFFVRFFFFAVGLFLFFLWLVYLILCVLCVRSNQISGEVGLWGYSRRFVSVP